MDNFMVDINSQQQLEEAILNDLQRFYSIDYILVTITDYEYYFNVNFEECLYTYIIKKDKCDYNTILITLVKQINKDVEESYENDRYN